MDLKIRLTRHLQEGLPLTERPYEKMAAELGCDERQVVAEIRRLLDDGTIRTFGAFADYSRLGYEGLLCGVAAPRDRIDETVSMLNPRNEITHNYLRDHEVNIWFTALLRDREESVRFTKDFLHGLGFPFVVLATRRRLKLEPVFYLGTTGSESVNNEDLGASPQTPPGSRTLDPIGFMGAGNCDGPPVGRVAVLSLLQRDFPLSETPFDDAAERLGCSTRELLTCLAELRRQGVLRRIGASLHHRRAGYAANSLLAWEFADRVSVAAEGGKAAELPWVSHCYIREAVESTLSFAWPYTLYTMIHAHDDVELNGRIETLRGAINFRAVAVLTTVREFKKARYLL